MVVVAANSLGDVMTVVGDADLRRMAFPSVVQSLELLLPRGGLCEEEKSTPTQCTSTIWFTRVLCTCGGAAHSPYGFKAVSQDVSLTCMLERTTQDCMVCPLPPPSHVRLDTAVHRVLRQVATL